MTSEASLVGEKVLNLASKGITHLNKYSNP